jgi:hypothetical protein
VSTSPASNGLVLGFVPSLGPTSPYLAASRALVGVGGVGVGGVDGVGVVGFVSRQDCLCQ